MVVPRHIAEHIDSMGLRQQGYHFADEFPCEGAQFHSPVPLVTFQVSLVGPTWPDMHDMGNDNPHVYLCGTCRNNLRLYQEMMETGMNWPLKREFGNYLRKLADQGWRYYQSKIMEFGANI